tara:strand:+ start:525 stop:1634 length:1110 start_codon:yes stop_codon:yes gene_type:complete
MFFSLEKIANPKFPNQYLLKNGLVLNTDDGWQTMSNSQVTIVYKGYVNHRKLTDYLSEMHIQSMPAAKGNFCAFISDEKFVSVIHDTNRAFPLWLSDSTLTNLYEVDEQIWADCVLTINNTFVATRRWYTPYVQSEQELSDEQVINKIHNTLCETVEQFLTHNTLPIKVFLSGGIDTTTAWAYIDYFTKNYELVDYQYVKYTTFYKRNSGRLKQFWGYNQIHVWDTDCVLVTGSNGDENMLRGPNTLAMILKYYGLTFAEILKPSDYHYSYLIKKTIDIDEEYATARNVFDYVLNKNINDHQHWHIDRTLTFTPFKDISLLETVLASNKELIVKQARTAYINRQLIMKLDSNKLSKLSHQKNYNMLENL